MFSFRTTPLQDQLDRALTDGKVGVFCTQNCWDTEAGRYVYDIFSERGNLQTVFTPRDAELTPDTNHIQFTRDALEGLNAVVVEIQDVGVRYFNYSRDVFHLMSVLKDMGEEAPSMYIVDHINPAGRIVEGTIPVVDNDLWVPKVAHRHGLTLGELACLYAAETGAAFPLHIISARVSAAGRDILPWVIPPASDIPGLFTCEMYSGGGLWNSTNVTPGIGTSRPYEYIGAPFIKPAVSRDLPVPSGVMMRPCSFRPSAGRYAGEWCSGYQIMLAPGVEYHSLLHTLRVMRYFVEHYSQFEIHDDFWYRLSDPVIQAYLKCEITFDIVQEHVKTEEQKWIRKAKRFTLYGDQPYRIK